MRVLFFLKQVNESSPSRNLLQLSFQIGNVLEEIILDTFGILFLCEDKNICRYSDLH